jgi:phosphate transport system substrate-binding protein
MVLQGSITEAGSTTVQPVAEALAEAFMGKYPNVTVTIQGGGSSVGVKSAYEGTVDIGAASRELKSSEVEMGVVPHVLAKDGIAIVTHPSNGVSDLTVEQVMKIFNGEITNWNQVGGSDADIHVVSREEGSGTRAAFEEMVMGDELIAAMAILQPSNGAVRTTVAGDENSIGYLSFGYLDDTTKALSISGVDATVENALNGTYPIVRPLLFITAGQPEGLVKEFLRFCLGLEGQTIVAEDYIPVIALD